MRRRRAVDPRPRSDHHRWPHPGRILAGEDVGLAVVALAASAWVGTVLVALWMWMLPVLGEIVMVEATVFAVLVAMVRIWMMRCPRWDGREDWQPVRARLRTVE